MDHGKGAKALKEMREKLCLTDGVEQEGNKESKMSDLPLLLKA